MLGKYATKYLYRSKSTTANLPHEGKSFKKEEFRSMENHKVGNSGRATMRSKTLSGYMNSHITKKLEGTKNATEL